MAKLKNKFTGQVMDFTYDSIGQSQVDMYKGTGMWEEVDTSGGGQDFSVTVPKFSVGFETPTIGGPSAKPKPLMDFSIKVPSPFGDDDDDIGKI